MDLSNLSDGIILIVSGALIALFGSGKLFPKLSKQDDAGKKKFKVVLIIGLIAVFAGVVQLARTLI